MDREQAREFEYRVVRQKTHTELERALNEQTADGWEPVQYAIWSQEGSGVHFVILRRGR